MSRLVESHFLLETQGTSPCDMPRRVCCSVRSGCSESSSDAKLGARSDPTLPMRLPTVLARNWRATSPWAGEWNGGVVKELVRLRTSATPASDRSSIASEGGADMGWATTVSVQPRATYRLSGWIKTEHVQSRARPRRSWCVVERPQHSAGGDAGHHRQPGLDARRSRVRNGRP